MGAESQPTKPEHKRELVRKVRLHAELLPALRAGARTAVFEGPAANIDFHRDEFGFNGRDMMDAIIATMKDFAKGPAIRAVLHKQLSESKVIHERLKVAMVQIYDVVTSDMYALAQALPNYELERFALCLYPNEHVTPWHVDDPKDQAPPGYLRYSACLQGASMEFAKDFAGTGRTTVGPNARVLFTIGTKNGSIHRAPPDWDPNRLMYTLWIKPRR